MKKMQDELTYETLLNICGLQSSGPELHDVDSSHMTLITVDFRIIDLKKEFACLDFGHDLT